MSDYPRHKNGVLTRRDGAGDQWAFYHRECLRSDYPMIDLDGVVPVILPALDRQDTTFIEYATRRESENVGFVAFFDRKHNEAAMDHQRSDRNHIEQVFLGLCRRVAETQSPPPLFVYIVGGGTPPWLVVSIDIYTGRELSRTEHGVENWREIWNSAGFVEHRMAVLKGLHNG